MNNKYLIQLSTSPIDPNDLEVNDWKLDKFFFEQNPWGLGRIEDVDRKTALGELKGLLPSDSILDPDKETINLPSDLNYLLETIERLKNIVLDPFKGFNALYSWLHREVCLFGDILGILEHRNSILGNVFICRDFGKPEIRMVCNKRRRICGCHSGCG